MTSEDAGNRNCINLNSGGGSTAPSTFSTTDAEAPSGGQRWIAFQPAEDCTVTITVGMVNNGRTFYLLNKDHTTTSDCVSSYAPGARYSWYDDWTVNLTGGTWYVIMGGGSKCLIHAMAFSTSCSATQPGTINKGTVSGGVITLTADGDPGTGEDWYWQSTADGTATTESGATKNVNTAGTYYIRSYKASETCWSAARSVVVDAEDFYEPSAAPVITTQPTGASYDAGETVTPLSVAATGSGTLSYQWRKDGVDISGANASSYTPTSSGTYTCVVTNTEAGHSPVSVVSVEAVIVIQSNTYILQGISGTSGTGTLTGDFYTGATTMVSVPSTSYDGVSYTNGLQLGGKIDSWDSNMSYHDRMVRYDCKTTHTEFTIVVYNKNGSAKKIYVGDIKENPIGTANTVSSLSSYSVSGTSPLTQTYTIDNDKQTPASLYITVESTDVRIVQIIANETGTPLPTPGSVGYTLNFNKPRIGVRSGLKAWLDETDFEYAPSSNTAAGNSERIQIGTKGTNYIQFRTDQPSAVKIGVQKNPEFYVADDKAGTLNAITIPKKSTDGGAIYTVMVAAGMHYIVPNGSNMYVTSLELTAVYTITFNANGGAGTMPNQLTGEGATQLNENLFVRPGYQFGGWALNPEGTGVITANEGTINVTSDMTLYAVWRDACHAVPELRLLAPQVSIWNGKKVDMRLVQVVCNYDTSVVKLSLKSTSEPISGCTFQYYDSQIHIVGTPSESIGAATTKNITFTIKNNCDPEQTFDVTVPIKIYPASSKPRIALLLTGTEGGAFTAYTASDKTKCDGLITYLSTWYDIVCVNGYATKDETAIANFYKDFDLLIVTDFMETPKGYTNAIGTLIDKKPILSFEAYVAGENGTNWHIDSNPKDPSPAQKDMKVLCAGHSVFGGTVLESDGETVKVLSSISGKGLQGFEINDAPDFMFLATVANGSGKLIVCCERQVVFPARLMLYCINFNEMGNLTNNGKLAMKQMIDYLLITDESDLADCALVFDDHNATGIWSDPANWRPGYNLIPTPYHPVRIEKPCTVDIDDAHASSVKINVGQDNFSNPLTGSITILPNASLTVAGFVNKVKDTRYATLLETDAADIVIEANSNNTGALVYGNKSSDVGATVQYYSNASGAPASPVWQYIGIPLQAGRTAIQMYYEAWMCRWSENSGLGGLWQWVENEDILVPFEGYCITQAAEKTYVLEGKLNAPIDQTLRLNIHDADGYAFAANSWTAPIKIKEMQDDDFENAEKTIYIYHTGSYANWASGVDPINSTTAKVTTHGQYAVVPIHAAKYVAGADSVIPSMQGFFVKTTGNNAKVQLVYKRVVYDSKYFKASTTPLRAPKRVNDEEPEVMRIFVSGEKGADQIYLLSRSDFSDQFEDGWDGRKIAGDTASVPTLAVVKTAGAMSVAAVSDFEERELIFRAGEDSVYTFHFDYSGETIYLYDRLTEQATEIATGNTYAFVAKNKTPMPRFLITANPPSMPMGVEQLDNGQWTIDNARKMIIDGQLYILRDNRFYDARGVRVTDQRRKEAAQ